MTYQRDPERIVPNDDIVRREHIAQRDAEIARRNAEEGGTGFIPIILTVLILLGVGYFAYSFMYPGHVSVAPRTTENTLPRTVTPAPAPTYLPSHPRRSNISKSRVRARPPCCAGFRLAYGETFSTSQSFPYQSVKGGFL